jgi:hypothetical protein
VRHLLGHTLELVENAPGLHDRDVFLDRALALAHSSLERLLGERLVREHTDEQLPKTLGLALNRHTAGLDLTRGQIAASDRLQRVVAERHVAAAVGKAFTPAFLLLAEFGSLGLKHVTPVFSLNAGSERQRWSAG